MAAALQGWMYSAQALDARQQPGQARQDTLRALR
jgi:hypothetical protein